MNLSPSAVTRSLIAAGALCFGPGPNFAADASVVASAAIEQTLAAAQQDKRGVTLYVHGQTVGGAVTRIEPGQWVELRNQQSSRIVVRLDRIDGVALP